MTRYPATVLPVPQAREELGRQVDEEVRYRGKDGSKVGHRMNRQPYSLIERTVHRITVDSQGQPVDQPARDASNESAKRDGGRRLEAGSRSRCCSTVAGGGGAASQKGRPAGREGNTKTRADGRKEGSMEKMEEQRAFYMWESGEATLIPTRRG